MSCACEASICPTRRSATTLPASQAGKPVSKLDIAGLARTLDRSAMQPQLAAKRLADWKLWATIAAAQSATLNEAMGDLIEVADLPRTARVAPGASEARPFCEVIEALGIAMGE